MKGMMRGMVAAAALTAAMGGAGVAQAADVAPPRIAAAPIEAFNPWMFRVRGLVVHPDASAKLYAGGVPIAGASADISTSFLPEFDITYLFTKNIAVELILGVRPLHVKGTGVLAGNKIGDAWLLPPTLTLQYHFTDIGAFKPYIGAGINYAVFFNEKQKGPFTSFDLKDSFGFALQAGVDIMLDKNWGLNIDVEKIWLEPDVKVNGGAITGKAKIDPWLFGVGITYKM